MITPIEDIIDEARQGRMFILVDDEDRENEGDLIIPADCVDDQAINFMAKHGRGLICLSLERKQADQIGLELMTRRNMARHETAFTVSIEAQEGVTTGISAADRAHTIRTAIAPDAKSSDIVTPGHVFPLLAKEGGVLARAGHTEAAVDISRLAGRMPAGVICEIMNDDGTMARFDDLVEFAKKHDLKLGTINDLIAWRRNSETLVERTMETTITSRFGGEFRMILYVNKAAYAEHVALVKGDLLASSDPVLVRMHALNVLDDVLYDANGRGGELQSAMQMIGDQGRGVIVLLREPQANSLSSRMKMAAGKAASGELRDYGVGAQILLDLGVRDMDLLTNHKKTIVGLDGYGLRLHGYKKILTNQ